jgi:DNA-binding PadR family transcriptional regulator
MKSSPLALTVLALLHYQPLHPYGVQRLIRQWGKDKVVNVEQRTALYRTIERLQAEGLIAVRETGRDQQYPERTVYEVTDEGRVVALRWLHEMVAVPANEYPAFPAALAQLLLFDTDQIASALIDRKLALTAALTTIEASVKTQRDSGLPRIAGIEDEYLRAVTAAELGWVDGILEDLASGALNWDPPTLRAFAAEQENGDSE